MEQTLKIFETYYWTDSKIVLCWLRSEARNFKTYVAHRVGEIQEHSDINKWKWVSSKLNIADIATRGEEMLDSSAKSEWFNGPSFLYLSEERWPQKDTKVEKDEEKRSFGDTFKCALEIQELQSAEKLWCTEVQKQCFEKEIQDLQNKKDMDKKGRTDTSPELNKRHQASYNIGKNRFTTLLIENYHKKFNHAGLQMVLNEIRQRFWIIQAEKELGENLQKLKEDKFKQKFIAKEIEWKFISPASAHMVAA
ncbi:hypothetical protein ILUMI_00062 [Ignelater luminosus]|uniref:Uncharacterized protein n=1 Tax=Ignelater luminosus TaxID=2038154 RepID=A0A8K0DML7_IGNLU|nr:hypothetical protein ILUMI_00062 [Ignelater luminosus]